MLSAKPWKLEGMLCLVAAIFCVVVASQLLLLHIYGKDKPVESSLLYLLLATLSLHGSILLFTALFLWVHRIGWSEAFGFSTPSIPRALAFGLLAALVFLPVATLLQSISIFLLEWAHIPALPQEAIQEFDNAASPLSRAYLAVFAIVLAPVAEEVLFRGIMYPALKQVGHPQFALWGSAFIFAAIHSSPAIFLPLLLLGLVLAWLYERTNNLLASITTHSVFNAINVVMLVFGDQLANIVHDIAQRRFEQAIHDFSLLFR